MKYVHLGDSNVLVSEFCLGTMMFGGKTGPEDSVRIIHRAVDAGVNFIDTADVYNDGRSEEIVGQALQGSIRDQVVLASKVGMTVGEGPNDKGISRFHIVRAVEASLKRLATDRIDLYYIHWPMTAMNLEEMVRALEDLIRQGKILYPAFSNFPAWLLTRTMWLQDVMGCAPMVAGQYPYNLIERGLEVEVLPAAAALGVGIVTYRPLSAGALTGKYLDGVPAESRGVSDDRLAPWSERYREGIQRLADMARDRGLTTADGAIAWVRSHPAVTAPIVGVSTMEQLEANLKGFEWEMTPEERDALSAAFGSQVWEEAGGNFPAWRRSYDIIA
ncbi:MAG TPA: aldo/keto reductase [Chloroflexi bacterium]|jgi:aryl-alcohol dehydrogenase-like predicted oxidoreductase|nr:aldo/keto reductase [Chloroflexota bacterium]